MTRAAWAARKGRSSKWITRTRRLAVYLRDGFRCSYCGRDLATAPRHQVTLDHLRPQVHGGDHHSQNLVTACASCNCARQERPWFRYATAGAVARIKSLRRRVLNLDLARALVRGEVSPVEAR